ncbi:MAG: hypothetical protein KY440_03445 [Actinobacteria bacterium]|nr:hypothetical protein [Actinomycetota bacterium]
MSLNLPTITISCTEPSHSPATVAVFERTVADYGDGVPEPSWHWNEELAVGGGPIDNSSLGTGKRAWRDTYRLPADDPDAAVFGRVQEHGPKTVVRSITTGADVLECRKCGLRRNVNRGRMEEALEKMFIAGVSSVRLRFLVAMLG